MGLCYIINNKNGNCFQDEATTEQRLASVNIRRKLNIWSYSGKTFNEDDHRGITQLLVAQALAYLSSKTVTSELRAEAQKAIDQAQKTLADAKGNLDTFLTASSNLKRYVESLSECL